MCLGMPGQVIEVVDDARHLLAVDIAGVRRTVNMALLSGDDQPVAGDWVLVHLGMAMHRIDEAEAIASQEMLEGFGDMFEPDGVERAAETWV
ncbi:MAG: HypC/HybG/HupF family hydrogenase formation chaperone [Candidatus Dormibacteria bacterium]